MVYKPGMREILGIHRAVNKGGFAGFDRQKTTFLAVDANKTGCACGRIEDSTNVGRKFKEEAPR